MTAQQSLTEKAAVMFSGTGERISVKAHRGDSTRYPDNSLEAIMSAVQAGVDAVEFDTLRTKDGVYVLLHNSDITSETNAAEFIGKAGYPTSKLVSDWTYEQIKALCYRNDKCTVTKYRIGTLQEALEICEGKVFVQVDDKSETLTLDILYGYAKEAGALECLLEHIYMYESSPLTALENLATKANDTEFTAFVNAVKGYAQSGERRKVYWPNESPNGQTYTGYPLSETTEKWNSMYDAGQRYFWAEDVIALMQYIATKN